MFCRKEKINIIIINIFTTHNITSLLLTMQRPDGPKAADGVFELTVLKRFPTLQKTRNQKEESNLASCVEFIFPLPFYPHNTPHTHTSPSLCEWLADWERCESKGGSLLLEVLIGRVGASSKDFSLPTKHQLTLGHKKSDKEHL